MRTLREALLSEELTLAAELALGPLDGPDEIIEQAKILAAATDAVQIPDHRHARPHLSNIAVAALLRQNGIDPVIQMNCRDRNRLALQSDILGARALGANNLLLLRGANFPDDHRPRSTGVFDLGAIDLIATAAAVRDGEVFVGSDPDGARDLYIGTIATVFDPDETWEPEKLTSKANAGAQFIQLQPCHDIDLLRAYMARLVKARLTWRLQVFASLSVFVSAETARELRKTRPESIVPPDIVKRLEDAGDQEAEGIALAADHLRKIADIPGLSGVTLFTNGDAQSIGAAIDASGLRQ